MTENNQLSDETKNNSTDTSSTDVSSAVIGNHENAIVPHKISNHDKLVQTMVMVDGEWINVNDTNDQANVKYDMHKVNKKVVEAQKGIVEAKNTADSAVKYADSAVSASKVNSDALVAQSSAIREAKSAMDSATAEIQQLKANTASDAAKIRADVAQVQSEVDSAKTANSASVEVLKSDINTAKQDLADVHDSLTKAQAAVEQNQKLINDSVAKITGDVSATKQDLANVHDSLAKAQADITANQKSINDNVAQINADITQDRKDITSAQQANADTAKQLDTYAKQAQEQGKTIKAVQETQDGFSTALASVQGNVTQITDTVNGLSASLKDAQGNVASVKAQADQLSATLTDHDKSITQLTATAKELSSTLSDADGRLSKVEQSATMQATTLSDLQGNLSQVKQQADGLVTTLKDAQGDIAQIQQKADGTLAQLKSAQGDIASLQTDVTGIKATLISHEGDIHTLQADSKSLKDDMQDAQGNISSLKKSATDLTSEMSSQDGRLSKIEQTAKEHSTTISDLGKKVDSNGGGVNLLTNTQLFDYNWTWDQIGHSFANGVLTLDGNDNATSRILQQLTDNDTTGKTFSVSFNARISADCDSTSIEVDAGPYDANKRINVTSKDFQHYKAENWQWNSVSIFFSLYVKSGKIDITNLKLEYGAIATPYSLAPSDLATISQAKQTADGITTTLKNVQGDVDQVTQKANGTSEQLADVRGDVTNIQKDVNGLKQTTADNAGNIHTLQSDSKTLKDDMADAKGNISSLQRTSTSLVSEFRDHDGRLSKVEQTATEHTSELADTKGNLDKVTQKANTLQLLLSDAQKNIQNIQLDAKGLHDTITGQSNQLASLNVTLNNLDSKYSGITGDLQSKQTALSSEQQQTKDMLLRKADKSEVDNVKGTVSQVSAEQKTMADQINQKVSSTEYQTLKDKVNNLRIGGRNLIPNSGTDIVIESKTTDGFPQWENKSVYQNLIPGKTYTFSVSATNTNGVEQASVRIFKESLDGKFINKEATHWFFNADGERHSFTFTTPNDDIHYDIWLYAGPMGKLQGKDFATTYHHPQLELGNIESDYSPNPDDIITAIHKNSTAIDQTNSKISLKADQTEVDKVKNTATQNSSRLNIMAGEISSKVTSTDVNNIVDKKGYATTSTVQSLITQKAGTINESIVKLDQTVKQGAENNVQLVRKSDFADGKGSWTVQGIASATNPAPPAELGQTGMNVLQTNTRDAYEDGIWYSVKPGEKFDVDFWCAPSIVYASSLGLEFVDKDKKNPSWQGVSTKQHGPWEHITGTITAPANASFAKPWLYMDKPADNTGNSAWLAKPSIRRQNASTVNAIQTLTASIDGLQSRVTNYQNDTSSKYTQLSNLMQSKVGTADFEQLKRSVDMQTLDSADINNMKTNGHYFVHNLANNPIGGWVYVDVTGDGKYRIRQDVYQDSWNKHKFRRWYGDHWTNWEEGATYSEITQLQYAINLRVQKDELLSQINIAAGHTLIQSNKIYFDADSFVMSPNSKAFIPSAYITNINADKITTGTLDAAKFNVKNFSADNITGGTLNGVVVKTGANDRYFQTSKDNIYWVRNDDMSLVGNDTYLNRANGLNIADMNNIQLTTWGGASVNPDGSIVNTSGNAGHPKIVVDTNGNWDPDDPYGTKWGGGPGDSEIVQWIGNKEYTALTQGKGFTIHLNDGNNNSKLSIQKDNKVGFYVGQGENGNQVNVQFAGDGSGFNVHGNFNVYGAKNSAVKTSQGDVAVSAYETAEYYFGDIGEGQTGDSGLAFVGIEKLFSETVNTSIPYQVFITAYGPGNLWVDQREHDRFVVKSDRPNVKFGWEIKAKRRGYENTRLQKVN